MNSKAAKANPSLRKNPRKPSENNVSWLKRNLADFAGNVNVVLVGGVNQTAFRLRVAQAHVRHDLQPSYWSHAMLLIPAKKGAAPSQVYEISLEPATGFGFPIAKNGLQIGELSQYRDAKEFPNIALISLPVEFAKIQGPMENFKMQRVSLDALESVLQWLGFVWGVGRRGNPLFDGYGIPSSAMLEVVLSGVGFDLTPGLESRSSCPEAIWQSAKWWHDYYKKLGKPTPTGVFHLEHELGGR